MSTIISVKISAHEPSFLLIVYLFLLKAVQISCQKVILLGFPVITQNACPYLNGDSKSNESVRLQRDETSSVKSVFAYDCRKHALKSQQNNCLILISKLANNALNRRYCMNTYSYNG